MLPLCVGERDSERDHPEGDGRNDAVELAELPDVNENFKCRHEEENETEDADRAALHGETDCGKYCGIQRPDDRDHGIAAVAHRAVFLGISALALVECRNPVISIV